MSKEKQIEEMSTEIREAVNGCSSYWSRLIAEHLYEQDYRKQSEGEWKYEFTLDGDDFYKCSVCGRQEVLNGLCNERNIAKHLPYCHCGAHMRGGKNE